MNIMYLMKMIILLRNNYVRALAVTTLQEKLLVLGLTS